MGGLVVFSVDALCSSPAVAPFLWTGFGRIDALQRYFELQYIYENTIALDLVNDSRGCAARLRHTAGFS